VPGSRVARLLHAPRGPQAHPSALAEEGATPHQIGSVTGHTSLKEIERNTAKAGRKPRNRGDREAEMKCSVETEREQKNCPTFCGGTI
jgi:hypothetical protein